jgi:hypothetical protein
MLYEKRLVKASSVRPKDRSIGGDKSAEKGGKIVAI